MMKSHFLCLVLLASLFCGINLARADGPTETQTERSAPGTSDIAAQAAPAAKFIQDLGNQAITVIADKSLTQPQRSEKYRGILRDAFDLKTISHFVIGRAWDGAPPEQRQEYLKLFEELVIRTYSDSLSFYSGEGFNVKGSRPESEKDIVVNSDITHPGGTAPTTVDWRVRQTDGKLAIVDVVIEGVSQSVTQRQEYSSIIQRDGGKLDGLLDLMRQRLKSNASDGEAQK